MNTHHERHTEPGDGAGRHGPHRPLVTIAAPAAPDAAVLLLHGGSADGLAPPRQYGAPALRMRPFATAIRRAPGGSRLLLASVRYRHRGWNGERADPAHDARRALDELTDLAPGLPVVLVGHSLGGRAALAVAGHPAVSRVVALAPWCPPGEPVVQLRERTVLVLHDERDRVTSAADSWDLVRRARRAGARIRGVPMPHGGHAMLRDARRWHRLTAEAVTAVLEG